MDNENKNIGNEATENEDVEDQNNQEETGSAGADKDGKDGKDSQDNGGDKGTGAKTFTQEQVTKMMTKEKNQGRAAALKELGIDPKDKKAIAMVKALIDSQKTDEQRQAEKDAEARSKQAEAEQRALVAEAKAEAMMIGIKSQYVEDAVTLALGKMTEDADLKTILGEFKTKYPIWFEDGGGKDDDKDGGKKTGQKGTGSSIKNGDKGGKKGDEQKGLGARLAAQRKSGAAKKSYWGNK